MTQDETPRIADHPERHQYVLTIGAKRAAHIAYRMHGEVTIDLVHTEVEREFEGQGLGSRIAKFAFDDAKSRGLKVIPTCTYIAGWVKKHPEYADLVAA